MVRSPILTKRRWEGVPTTAATIYGIYGTSANDVYAVGPLGTIVHLHE
jgi:hypothetical protein